ncbi:helix-turn-helix domain-containing protein [Actinomadura litoris]|uniref:helix-turn-helix domain-containing protein n=1 Tax=Actinomadura litoris TaxID=2678616 RepID=UPI001FA81617|nr:helix-turn-helix transcriptional regulator [Actinomadura litoris]
MVFYSRREGADDVRIPAERETCLASAMMNEIAWFMRKNGIKRSQLADEMKVSPGRVTQILSGEENVTLRTLETVVTALGARLEVQMHPLHDSALPMPKGDRQPVGRLF